MEHPIYTRAKALAPEITAWRRSLHQIPELGLDLPRTSAFVQEALRELGIPFRTGVNGSCVVGQIGGGDKCFLLRADMDALPIREESALPFASDSGRMHSCGHDLHAACLLGAAKLLKEREDQLPGTVLLLFQPGEETFNGAKAVLESGLLDAPEVGGAFAMHVFSQLDVGTVVYGTHPMSSVYGFRILLEGVGGHGSTPEKCVDPINAGVHIYLALQELVARECAASEEVALTIGQFQAGDAANVIPERAVLQGTLRTFDPHTAERVIRRIRQVSEGVAATYRAGVQVECICNVPSVTCDPALNQEIVESGESLGGGLLFRDAFHMMGSEDFAFLSQRFPHASYFAMGAGVPDPDRRYGQHNAKVQFNEDCLPIGAALYAKTALDWLVHHA